MLALVAVLTSGLILAPTLALAAPGPTTTRPPTAPTTTTTIVGLAGRASAPSHGEGALRTITLAAGEVPGCMAATSDGTFWALNRETPFSMIEVPPSGPAHLFAVPGAPPPDPDSQCLVVGPDGNLWFADPDATTKAGVVFTAMARFDIATHVTTFFRVPAQGSNPQFVAANQSGTGTGTGNNVVWFLEVHANRIGEVDMAGNVTELPAMGFTGLYGLVVEPDGNLWVSGTDAAGSVLIEVTSAGTELHKITAPGAGPLALGPGGNVWFTWGDGLDELTSALQPKELVGNPIVFPASLAVGPDGRVWFASAWFGCVWSVYGYYHSSGKDAVDYTSPGCASNLVAGPRGIAFSAGAAAMYYLTGTAVPEITASKVSTIARSVPTPPEAFRSLKSVAIGGGITAAVTMLLTFPSQLFDSTFEENYGRISRWWRKRFGWLVRVVGRLKAMSGGRQSDGPGGGDAHSAAHGGGGGLGEGAALAKAENAPRNEAREDALFAAVLLVGAFFCSFNDPGFGFKSASVLTYFAMVLALGVGIFGPAVATGMYHLRRHGSAPRQLKAVPGGLAVALLFVIFSRLVGFEPGYVYGVVCGVFFTRELTSKEKGRVAALGSLTVISVSVTAWLVWWPVSSAALKHGASPLLVLLDDFLAAVFVSGLVGTFIGMMPIKGLPGWTIKSWNRRAWIGGFALSGFGIVQILLQPGIAGHPHRPLIVSMVLFVAFGAGSIAFYEHFEEIKRKATGAGPQPWAVRLHNLVTTAQGHNADEQGDEQADERPHEHPDENPEKHTDESAPVS